MPRCPKCYSYNVTDYKNCSKYGITSIMGRDNLLCGPNIPFGCVGIINYGRTGLFLGTTYICNDCGYKF